MGSLTIHEVESKVVPKELIKISKICFVFEFRTTNLTTGVKVCVSFILLKIELIILGPKVHHTKFVLAANLE